MLIKCVREGRVGFHVGDTLEVPDDTEIVGPDFVIVEDDDKAKAKAQAEKDAAEKNAKAEAKAEADKLAADLAEKNESGTV